ncbi:MAG: RNA polymerase factor sigma-54 [Ignavibacteriota bacterium]|nr:RNA polymerase factor sigma-54 [Ignavibacteriota bacterium]
MFKQTQTQKQLQRLMPQIIQKQNLLAIPTMALEQMVKQEMELNPFLEEAEDIVEEIEIDDGDALEDIGKTEVGDEQLEKVKKEDEEYDTDDYVNSEYEGYKTTEDYDNSERPNYENMWSTKVTLKDNLLTQLHLNDLTEKEMFIGEEIIWSIDDEGYFRDNIQDVITDLNKQKIGTAFEEETFTEEELLKVLEMIQTFEPIGIGSRNLEECLITQLKEHDVEDSFKELCIKILNNNFEEFRLKNYEKLMREYNITIDEINNLFNFISHLNPKPGYVYEASDSIYIYPDILITSENGEYKVELNDKSIPSLRLNEMYSHLMKSGDKEAKDFVKNNFERAKWFLESLRSRKETLLKVMYSILHRQKDFFDSMGKTIRPLLEKEIAEDISMDISTVSRTVRGKYVQTIFGIYELKHFFSYHITNESGDDISTKEVKKRIEEIIIAEEATKPYTDDDLVVELHKHGYKLARRTVAKYRESLKIPVARMRRKLSN